MQRTGGSRVLTRGAGPISTLSAALFRDEAAAFAKLESLLGPEGPVCPYCGGMGRIMTVKGGRTRSSATRPELTREEQRRRFVEAAGEAGASEDEAVFEAAS